MSKETRREILQLIIIIIIAITIIINESHINLITRQTIYLYRKKEERRETTKDICTHQHNHSQLSLPIISE